MSNKNVYLPGLHVLGTIHTDQTILLTDYSDFKIWLIQKIVSYELTPLGDFYHSFEGGGYTGMICLTESHIAFHTWPEYNLLTIDIFLSNYQKENDDKARGLFEECVAYFKATSVDKNEVKR
jgi:S-adenosylmethionine decarboxylase